MPRNDTNSKDIVKKKSAIIKNISFLDYRPNFAVTGILVATPDPLYSGSIQELLDC